MFKDAKNKSSKVKKPISTKVKLIAKKPRKIKAALKSWVEASDKVNSDPLNLNGAPLWVENAYAEVVKVLMPSNRLPTSGDVDLELYGELFGRLQAFGKVFSGEIPMGLEAQAELDRLQTLAASQNFGSIHFFLTTC